MSGGQGAGSGSGGGGSTSSTGSDTLPSDMGAQFMMAATSGAPTTAAAGVPVPPGIVHANMQVRTSTLIGVKSSLPAQRGV